MTPMRNLATLLGNIWDMARAREQMKLRKQHEDDEKAAKKATRLAVRNGRKGSAGVGPVAAAVGSVDHSIASQEATIHGVSVSLAQAVSDCLQSEPCIDLYEKMCMFVPVRLDVLQRTLAAAGVKIGKDRLRLLMDGHAIFTQDKDRDDEDRTESQNLSQNLSQSQQGHAALNRFGFGRG
jgi:hypothetical protein